MNSLIEPFVKYSEDDKLIEMLNNTMTTEEQKLFIQSFKTYLDHGHNCNEFVINLDDIWKWLGFTRLSTAKRLFLANFKINHDYICNKNNSNKTTRGGQNKQTIHMTVNTFKKFCMKASTSRADDVQNYYIKMEEILYDYIHIKLQESKETTKQLEQDVVTFKSRAGWAKHDAFLAGYDETELVYVLNMFDIDENKYVMKNGVKRSLRTFVNSDWVRLKI